jgi:hypothetical protein
MRRLGQVGALPLKRSAYLLPNQESTLEDFQWLQREIHEEGGEAWVVEARFISGMRDEEIRDRFRELRAADYRVVISDARALLDTVKPASSASEDAEVQTQRRRLARRLDAVRRIDFFQSDSREEAEAVMAALERGNGRSGVAVSVRPTADQLRRRVWMTRAGIKVDRMASAWLIRRFIDSDASFVFAAPDRLMAPDGAIRFDMFEGEFTHDGSRCTFEVLLDIVNRPGDRALATIGQIVHDLDLHDDRYQRPETAGVAAMVAGVVAQCQADEERLKVSGPMFDALYASLGGQPLAPSKEQS